jgi:hypothetical protein
MSVWVPVDGEQIPDPVDVDAIMANPSVFRGYSYTVDDAGFVPRVGDSIFFDERPEPMLPSTVISVGSSPALDEVFVDVLMWAITDDDAIEYAVANSWHYFAGPEVWES